MDLRHRLVLFAVLVLVTPAFTACKEKVAPTSQPADDFPVHSKMLLVSDAPTELVPIVADLEDWLFTACSGDWSYYTTSDNPDTVMEWYGKRLPPRGWRNAVEEEGRLPETARLSNVGVWYDPGKDKDRLAILVTQPITPPLSTGVKDEPDQVAYVIIRQCALAASH